MYGIRVCDLAAKSDLGALDVGHNADVKSLSATVTSMGAVNLGVAVQVNCFG
jgi:hypothetical protein